MNTRKIILLAGLAVVGFMVFTLARSLTAPVPTNLPQQPIAPAVEYVDVLVASREIPFGTRLSTNDFRWQKWPSEAIIPNSITSDTNPQAMTNYEQGLSRSIIYEGEPITESKVIRPGEAGLMASLLTTGMRAVTTRISVDTAAGGFIQPGDRVDIILTLEAEDIQGTTSNVDEYVSTTIFEDVRVLAIDQTFSTSSEDGATVIGSTATFELSQDDAEILQRSASEGDISLTLRPLSDKNSNYSGRSHATIEKVEGEQEATSLVVYRAGQPQSVALAGN